MARSKRFSESNDIEVITDEMMRAHRPWPNVLLALKNPDRRDSGGWPQLGYMSRPADKDGVTICVGNIFSISRVKEEHFDSVAAAIAAGWRVD